MTNARVAEKRDALLPAAPTWKCPGCGATLVLVSPRLIEGVALSRCEACQHRPARETSPGH